jgi:hypothetical protein
MGRQSSRSGPITEDARRAAAAGLSLRVAFFTAMLVLCEAARVAACPSCATGQQARSDVWSDGFFTNMAIALLPFLVIGVICVWLESGARGTAQREESGDVS